MTDKIMAIAALATMIAFLLTVVWFVPDKDLMVVIALVSMLAIYDFWSSFRANRKNRRQ
jgi:hypothetical protein